MCLGDMEGFGVLDSGSTESRQSPLFFGIVARKPSPFRVGWFFAWGRNNGEAGIRTLDTLRYTRFPSARTRPGYATSPKFLLYFILKFWILRPSKRAEGSWNLAEKCSVTPFWPWHTANYKHTTQLNSLIFRAQYFLKRRSRQAENLLFQSAQVPLAYQLLLS